MSARPQNRKQAHLPPGWKNCLNCLKAFPPPENKRVPPERKKFCGDECRKEFWRHGGVSVHRLMVHVEKRIKEVMPDIMNTVTPAYVSLMYARIQELERRVAVMERSQ